MKYSALAFLVLWGSTAYADVYEWVDNKGETHFSESVPKQGAKDVKREMTQQQIQQMEKSDQNSQTPPPAQYAPTDTAPADTTPQPPAGDENALTNDEAYRVTECARYKKMRENLIMDLDPAIDYSMSHNYGKGVLMMMYNTDGSAGITDMNKIEQGIRKYCN